MVIQAVGMETVQIPKSGRQFVSFGRSDLQKICVSSFIGLKTGLHKSDCLNILLVIKDNDIR